jgi:hypothetical protein
MVRSLFVSVLIAVACPLTGHGQNAPSALPYDGIQAGLDAYRLAEERRQIELARQLSLMDQARADLGYPASRGATVYYGYPSREAAYAYGLAPVIWPPLVFEPWPLIPGDIYGYPLNYLPARQSTGQTQLQTGPKRWESHPVYDPPLTQYQPLPPVESATTVPDPELIPPPPAPTSAAGAEAPAVRPKGPREY